MTPYQRGTCGHHHNDEIFQPLLSLFHKDRVTSANEDFMEDLKDHASGIIPGNEIEEMKIIVDSNSDFEEKIRMVQETPPGGEINLIYCLASPLKEF